MKKFVIISQFLIYTTIASGQSDTLFSNSPLDFYPLNIGDIRHYQNDSKYDLILSETYYISEKVLKDTLIDDMNFKKIIANKYFITRGGDTLSQEYISYERIDTLTYEVYEKRIINNRHLDKIVICLNAQPGDSCIGRKCSIFYQNLFDNLIEVKSFDKKYVYDGWGSYDKIEIATNLGITYDYSQTGNMLDITSLKYAWINGIEYGTPIPILENLYQEDSTDSEDDSISIESKPESYILYQNYPNPFNSYTTISYNLPFTTNVQIEIYDILGRSVQLLVKKEETIGKHTVEFDASNLGSGIYMYKLHTGNYTQVKKMLLIK
jgi:hypothetical protein